MELGPSRSGAMDRPALVAHEDGGAAEHLVARKPDPRLELREPRDGLKRVRAPVIPDVETGRVSAVAVSEQGATPVVGTAGSTVVDRAPAGVPAKRFPFMRLRLAARRLAAPLLVLATGAAAALPVIVATVHAVKDGWMPAADQAIIATRAYDVFTSHMPLVGQYTTAAGVIGHVTSDPGPMLYWLVAIPARFGSPASITVTMGAVNALAVVGCVALARRRGGRVLMFAVATGIAFMCRSLAAETFHDEWNASAGLFPLTLLIFVGWSLGCGDHPCCRWPCWSRASSPRRTWPTWRPR
jgi:hypothetical protein